MSKALNIIASIIAIGAIFLSGITTVAVIVSFGISTSSKTTSTYSEAQEKTYSIVTVKNNMFGQNIYGYIDKNSKIVVLDTCNKNMFTQRVSCADKNNTAVLTYSTNNNQAFNSPTLKVKEQEYYLVCDIDPVHGRYCTANS